MHAIQAVFESLCGNRKVLDQTCPRPVRTLKLVMYIYFLRVILISIFFKQTTITLPNKSVTNTLKPTNQPKHPKPKKLMYLFFGK